MDKEDVVYTYNGILLSHKNEIMSFAATWMDLEIIILGEGRKKDESLIYGNQNVTQINLSVKPEQTQT